MADLPFGVGATASPGAAATDPGGVIGPGIGFPESNGYAELAEVMRHPASLESGENSAGCTSSAKAEMQKSARKPTLTVADGVK
jgi:hypothetical protein